jgi:hypothetical protein
MRTREQIVADCEKRFEELRAEKERRDGDPRHIHPCATCRWAKGDYKPELCTEPLVKGFGEPHAFRQYAISAEEYMRTWQDGEGRIWNFPKLCGPEKALWQPKPTWWQRIIEWLA